MELPKITKRIKVLIDEYSNGNVADFVRLTGISSHQVLNRIFSIDPRSKKYPNPSGNILTSIQMSLPEVNYSWLLSGEGSMLVSDSDIKNLSLENIIKYLHGLSQDYLDENETWQLFLKTQYQSKYMKDVKIEIENMKSELKSKLTK